MTNTKRKNINNLTLFITAIEVYNSLNKYKTEDKIDQQINKKKLAEMTEFIQDKYGIIN